MSTSVPANLYLAPMEGVVDHHLRRLLTEVGGYSQCVTEFVRVTNQLLPSRTYYRLCPELKQQGKTASGVPVIVQILGSDSIAMAENAAKVAEMGAPGIDINFGCPAKTVTSKQGGSSLLREPEKMYEIVSAVRRAVPKQIPVSAKMRLGYESADMAVELAKTIEQAGASSIVVHARTKVDGYRHPARWEWFAMIKEAVSIPMIVNGDIKSVESYLALQDIFVCDEMMLGRGAIARPALAREIVAAHAGSQAEPLYWNDVVEMLIQIMQAMEQEGVKQKQIAGRIKQWLVYLKSEYPEALALFSQVRVAQSVVSIRETLLQEGRYS